MNSVHQTMARALEPFTAAMKPYPTAVAQALITGQAQHPNQTTRISTDLYHFQFTHAAGLVIDCHLEYTKAEPASHDSPGEPESLELIYALVNGVDVFEVLSDDVVGLIEEEAAQSMAMDKWESDYDRAEERALDREAYA